MLVALCGRGCDVPKRVLELPALPNNPRNSEGDLPPNAQRLVRDWLPKHQDELAEMWRTQKIVELPPLD